MKDMDFSRAERIIERQDFCVGYLIQFWHFAGAWNDNVPWPEKSNPWWQDIKIK